MNKIPTKPFLTESFSPRGGGIDFLGMRAVNLRMLQEFLIPGINNATADFGTYCLAAWIPWKFLRLATNKQDFTYSRYQRFREAVEIAIAFTQRPESEANNRFGTPRTRIGIQQKVEFDKPLTFAAVKRTDATSLFAAPLYGPSLRYLKLIAESDAQAIDGTSTHIPLAMNDDVVSLLVEAVEASLQATQEFANLNRLDAPTMTSAALDDLGMHGLHPSYYRNARPDVKRAFLSRFVEAARSGDGADYRRRTTRLVCETIRQHAFSDPDELRAGWYSGLLPTGEPLVLSDPELQSHRTLWALFQLRQIQRTIAETFLRCFEAALDAGVQDVPSVIEYWRKRSPEDVRLEVWGTFDAFVRNEAASISTSSSYADVSAAWHATVHHGHPLYEDIPGGDDSHEFARAFRMMARWWIRAQHWIEDPRNAEFLTMGERSRMSMYWFAEWIRVRLGQSLSLVAEEIFSEIVFSQHIKVALSRFDGQVQRLRFTLGDSGLIPTTAAKNKLGQSPVRMADRLSAFLGLLSDLDVVAWPDGSPMALGSNAQLVPT